MKQSHTSRPKSPKVRQCLMVLPILNLPGLPSASTGMDLVGKQTNPPGQGPFCSHGSACRQACVQLCRWLV